MSAPATARRGRANRAARVRPYGAVIGVAGALCAIAVGLLAAWPGFAPKHVEVEGNSVVAASDILARAAVAHQTSMWLQNTTAMAQRVEAIPYVLRAGVRRLPPATMVIAVSEREPFATVRSGSKVATIDADLRVLQLGMGTAALPVFVAKPGLAFEPGAFLDDRSVLALRGAYDAMTAAHVAPVAVALDRYGGLVATLPTGVRLLLGDADDLSKKLGLVDPILTQIVHDRRHLEAIDLRAPGTPVVVWK